MNPRILMLVQRFPPDLGGLAASGARIARALDGLGAEVDVVAWTRLLPPGELVTSPLRDAPGAAGPSRLHRLGLYGSDDLSFQHTLNVLEWLHDQRGFDCTWGHYLYPAGFLAVWFGRQAGVPSTVSARGNDIDKLMFPPGDFGRLHWTLQNAGAITAVSQDLARKITSLIGVEGRVVVMRNVVQPDLFAPGPRDPKFRESLGIPPQELVLGFSGELRHKKGIHFLLDALVHVRRERPACLLVIGDVRAREQEHLAAFRHEHSDDAARLLVTGHTEDTTRVAACLRECDLFLMPSVWEGLPNALLEAMASGAVSIASDAGGIAECIDHGENGFLVPKTALHRLGEAVLEVAALSDEQRERVGQSARNSVLARFHPDRERESLAGLLRSLTGGRDRSAPTVARDR